MTTETRVKLQIVDADGHFIEPNDLRPYIDPKWRDQAPHRIPGNGNAWSGRDWQSEGCPQFGTPLFTRPSETQMTGLIGVHRKEDLEQGKSASTMYEKMDPRIVDNKGRLLVMDEESIDASVLYPTSALAWVPDGEYHVALNAALNNWLHEWCQADPARLYGATNIVAIHDVEAACDEVRRCKKDFGFPAVFLRTTLPNAEVRWWDKSFDPFWATCEELGVAVGFHPFPGDSMYGSARYFDIIGPTSELVFMRTPFNIPVDSMHAVMGTIIGGVAERFPGLRLAILESSGGWLVSFLERLDSRFEHMGHTLPHLKMSPSEYFKRNWWISFDPEEAALKMTIDWLGADRIIWGSDYPHPDAFYPGFVQMLNDNLEGVPEEDQAKIRGRNAVDFYRLEG